MKNVVILTKTNWSEPPRIRHQITRLLKSKGYNIVFFEKNSYKNLLISEREEDGIKFFGHSELIHHQLRYFPIIQNLNNLVVKFYLKKILGKMSFDVILNFCYDYNFLKELTEKKIITVIEDDFESQAKLGMVKQIRNQVQKTCENSDVVLTVSYPLYNKLIEHNKNTKLFFPWSQRSYIYPSEKNRRNVVLYFGFIHRMDWTTVETLIKDTNYQFRFVGPAVKSVDKSMINHLSKTYRNFQYIPFCSISDLNIDDVFCSILPYDPSIKSVQACTVSNRAFNLLSLGLPLVYADLKNLISAPLSVIRKNKTTEEYKSSLDYFKYNFFLVQNDISSFLENHYENSRWKILEEFLNN